MRLLQEEIAVMMSLCHAMCVAWSLGSLADVLHLYKCRLNKSEHVLELHHPTQFQNDTNSPCFPHRKRLITDVFVLLAPANKTKHCVHAFIHNFHDNASVILGAVKSRTNCTLQHTLLD
jgi:hypothetical protein